MRLRDLNAHFVGRAIIVNGDVTQHEEVDTLTEAQGIMFQCPKCASEPGHGPGTGLPDGIGCRGVHYVLCWFEDRGIPDTANPKPGRWNPTGTSLDDLSFVPGKKSHSIQLLGACNWHGFVTNGDAT